MVRHKYSFYLVDLLQMTAWLTSYMKHQSSPAKNHLYLVQLLWGPSLPQGRITETCSQGRWLALWVQRWVGHSKGAVRSGENRCKQLLLHEAECHSQGQYRMTGNHRKGENSLRMSSGKGGEMMLIWTEGASWSRRRLESDRGDWGWGWVRNSKLKTKKQK